MAGEIKVGYVVQLKSGGPRMTVSEIDGNDVYCQWFGGADKSGKGTLEESRFVMATLEVLST